MVKKNDTQEGTWRDGGRPSLGAGMFYRPSDDPENMHDIWLRPTTPTPSEREPSCEEARRTSAVGAPSRKNASVILNFPDMLSAVDRTGGETCWCMVFGNTVW